MEQTGCDLILFGQKTAGKPCVAGAGRLYGSWIGVEALYAVWLELPESGNYAIFNTAGAGTIADAVSNANDLYCVELTENFKMPTLQRSDTATAEEISFWSSNSNSSMIYYEGEEFMPNNGM